MATKLMVEVSSPVTLKGTYRENKDVARDQAKPYEVVCYFDKLSADDVLEWAYAQMIVAMAAKLRSKNPPKLEESGEHKGKYVWHVEPRGTRTIADPKAKLDELVGDVAKLNECQRFRLMVAAGVPEDQARQFTGCTPEIEAKQQAEMDAAAEKLAKEKKDKKEQQATLKAEQDALARYNELNKKPEGERTDEEKLFMADYMIKHAPKAETK